MKSVLPNNNINDLKIACKKEGVNFNAAYKKFLNEQSFKYILILLLFFAYAGVAPKISADERENEKLLLAIRQQYERLKLSRIEELMDLLEIKPGMTILDLGTGTGQAAYKFAERLKGTGRVFATDILADRIDYVKKEARRRGLHNLYPVLVKREGVDEFYGKQKYDLIMFFYGSLYYEAGIEYFKEMRNFLAENGRLVCVTYQFYSPFSLDDFTDFEGLVKELSGESITSPFYKRLRKLTLESMQKSQGRPEGFLKKALIDDFDGMLTNLYFFRDFLKENLAIKEDVSFLPEERDYVNWFLMYLKDKGVFEKAQQDLAIIEIEMIKMVNKMFFIQRFRKYLSEGGKSPFTCRPAKAKANELENVGYELEKEYKDFIPFVVILIFRASKTQG